MPRRILLIMNFPFFFWIFPPQVWNQTTIYSAQLTKLHQCSSPFTIITLKLDSNLTTKVAGYRRISREKNKTWENKGWAIKP